MIKHFPKRPAQIKQNKLGKYNLLQTLGEGEYGKVKLAVHSDTGEEVAIKLIRKDGAGSNSLINKVEREISILKHLKHPHIVKLYEVLETDKYVGLVLEYASGGELFEYILVHRYLKENDAKRFFAQLLSSVQYMHKCKIVHRDLKLENVLIDKNRNIIVTDFGFANQFSTAADDMMSTTCGSPCYAAPELVINAGLYAGSAVDIWSCGIILFAMLCGFLPFDDDPSNPDSDDINQLYRYILSTRLVFPSHISPQARELLEKMLVPDPAKRCTLDFVAHHVWLEDYRDILVGDQRGKLEKSYTMRKVLTENNDRFAPITNDVFLQRSESVSSSARTSKIPSFITRKPIKEIRSPLPPTIPEVTTSTENQSEPTETNEKFLGLFNKSKEDADHSETCMINNSEDSLTTKSIFSRFAEQNSQPSSFTESGLTTSTHSSVSLKDQASRNTTSLKPNKVKQDPPDESVSPEPTQSGRFTMAAVRRSIYRKTKTPINDTPRPLVLFAKEPVKSPENKKKNKMIDWIKKKSHKTEDQEKEQEPRSKEQKEEQDVVKEEKREDLIEYPQVTQQRTRISSSNTSPQINQEAIDTRIQIHQGPIDRAALTSRPPQKIIKEVERILRILGIEASLNIDTGPFILECTRRKSSKRHEEEGLQPIYGEAAIDNGEEIRFTVEMCRFKNLPGLFIVDVKRIKGDVWTFKFLYHKLIDFLDLNKDDYL